MTSSESLSKNGTPSAPSLSANGLKRRRVVVMLLFFVVSFGLYYPVWFLRRRAALNSLDSPRKLRRWPFLAFIAYWALAFMVGLARGAAPQDATLGGGPDMLFVVVRLTVGILMVVQCFFVKDILEDHLAGREDTSLPSMLAERIELSGLMTFFFQIFYLQYVINRHLAGSRMEAV